MSKLWSETYGLIRCSGIWKNWNFVAWIERWTVPMKRPAGWARGEGRHERVGVHRYGGNPSKKQEAARLDRLNKGLAVEAAKVK